MENVNVNKRYNKFRQARRKKDKSHTINFDEASGRHYKLERFLRDCILHLPKHEGEYEDDLDDFNVNSTAPKPSRPKHVKLPVLNECKGLFENAIIGRSAKKADEFGGIAATPEDRARLHEDIHALAKVGPDSELSFELPTSPLQNRPVDEVQERNEVQERPISPPERVIDTSSPKAPGGGWPEKTRSSRSRSPEEQEPNAEAGRLENLLQEHPSNSVVNDSGFKDSTGSRKDDPAPFLSRPPSTFHCDCCPKTKRPPNFFDPEAILKSNDPSEPDPDGSRINVIFSNQKDPIWLFEDAPGGPANSPGSTYRPRDEASFDFRGIEIQSSGPQHFGCGGFGDERPDVYTGRCREPPAVQGMLKRRVPWLGFTKDVKRYNLHNFRDPRIILPDNAPLPHTNTYDRFRFNRSLSPRKY